MMVESGDDGGDRGWAGRKEIFLAQSKIGCWSAQQLLGYNRLSAFNFSLVESILRMLSLLRTSDFVLVR